MGCIMSDNVGVKIQLGHKAEVRDAPTKKGHTHDWAVHVQGEDGVDLAMFVRKIVFWLDKSFENSKRTVRSHPFTVEESGYAGFDMLIDVHFKNREEPRMVRYNYDLFLRNKAAIPVNHRRVELLTFSNPSEDFRKKLLSAGGLPSNPGAGVKHSPTKGAYQNNDIQKQRRSKPDEHSKGSRANSNRMLDVNYKNCEDLPEKKTKRDAKHLGNVLESSESVELKEAEINKEPVNIGCATAPQKKIKRIKSTKQTRPSQQADQEKKKWKTELDGSDMKPRKDQNDGSVTSTSRPHSSGTLIMKFKKKAKPLNNEYSVEFVNRRSSPLEKLGKGKKKLNNTDKKRKRESGNLTASENKKAKCEMRPITSDIGDSTASSKASNNNSITNQDVEKPSTLTNGVSKKLEYRNKWFSNLYIKSAQQKERSDRKANSTQPSFDSSAASRVLKTNKNQDSSLTASNDRYDAPATDRRVERSISGSSCSSGDDGRRWFSNVDPHGTLFPSPPRRLFQCYNKSVE